MANNYEDWGKVEQTAVQQRPGALDVSDAYGKPEKCGCQPVQFDAKTFTDGRNNEFQAWIGKNEPFAAHGHQFDNQFLNQFFSKNMDGYRPTGKVDLEQLSPEERAQFDKASAAYKESRQQNVAMAQIRPDSMKTENSQVLPESATQPLDAQKLANCMTDDQIALARQELFARHGYWFDSPNYQDHFLAQKWYMPQDQPTAFSPVEQQNLKALQAAERIASQRH